jgi:hypothetical protein
MSTQTAERFTRFADFYPFYLAEHSNLTCRRLHYIGSLLVLAILAYAVITQQWLWLLAMPFAGYGFAWVGHFIFEKNRPATFQYPLYSFLGDSDPWIVCRCCAAPALGHGMDRRFGAVLATWL